MPPANKKDKVATPTTPAVPTIQKKRKYSGPEKGSDEAKKRMEGVRAAQWAKAGLVQGG